MAVILNIALAVVLVTLTKVIGGHSATVPFYRYWNGRDHFYTTDIKEIGTAVRGQAGRHGYRSEGIDGYLESTQVSGTVPLYRYWNGANHFYTTDSREIGTTTRGVKGKYGYVSEGIAGYCYPHPRCGKTPLYRAVKAEHFYTTNFKEMARATRIHGYKLEKIACYVSVNC